MTKPARGVFRAISSFARYVTPTAPGNLSISKSQVTSPAGSGEFADRPTTSMNDDSTILQDPITLTPPFFTPATSTTDLSSFEATLRDSQSVPLSTHTLRRPVTSQASRPIWDMSSRQNTASSSTASSIAIGPRAKPPVQHSKATEAPTDDDAGPRWEDDLEADNRALPGTAGHSGVYAGQNVKQLTSTKRVELMLYSPSRIT